VDEKIVWTIIGYVLTIFINLLVVAFASGKTQSKVDEQLKQVKEDVHNIRNQLGDSSGNSVFVRRELSDERYTNTKEDIKSLLISSGFSTSKIDALEKEVAMLKAVLTQNRINRK